MGTAAGLVPASEQQQRAHAWPIHSATDGLAKSLIDMWRDKTPKEAHEVLARTDVRVTNASDKTTHLPKILRLDEDVREAFAPKPHVVVDEAALEGAPAVSIDIEQGELSKWES